MQREQELQIEDQAELLFYSKIDLELTTIHAVVTPQDQTISFSLLLIVDDFDLVENRLFTDTRPEL